MSDMQEIFRPPLTSVAQAIEVGFAEGVSIRENGGQVTDLEYQRTTLFEIPFSSLRGPKATFYESWRRAFDAGYLGHDKPASK